MRTFASLTLAERTTLGWGKVRRFYLSHFRPGYVRRSLERRVGGCNRTGACCRLLYTCPILDTTASPVRCRVHEIKPKVCRTFPIDERDLRDRDIIAPDHPCGFAFLPAAAVLARGGGAPDPPRPGSLAR